MNGIRLENIPLDARSGNYLQEIQNLDGVEEVVFFPDTFTKEKFVNAGYKVTIPSSVAIATTPDILYPQFRTRGINCGMMAVRLPVHSDEISHDFAQKLFTRIAYSLPYYLLYRLRLPLLSETFDLSVEEFVRVLRSGARVFAKKYGMREDIFECFDDPDLFGSVNIEEHSGQFNADWFKRRTVRLRHAVGRYFGGNHFMEISRVCNSTIPELPDGQAVILFHTAGESLEDLLAPHIVQEFIRTDTFRAIPRTSKAHDAFFAAHRILMNYGQTYRFITFLLINSVVRSYFGDNYRAEVIVDRAHNYVHREKVGGLERIVYRHNAEALRKNRLSITSGSKHYPSHLVRGGDNTAPYLNAIDHGLGKMLERSRDRSRATGGRVRYTRFKRGLRMRQYTAPGELMQNPAVEEYFETLARDGVAQRVATFIPMHNMKYT